MKSLKIAVALLLAVTVALVVRNQIRVYLNRQAAAREEAAVREAKQALVDDRQNLFDELKPVALQKCQLERFGEANDGGYLVCGNLLDNVQSAYSYGISGYDGWGCDISTRRAIPVHQYDCFNLTRPSCPGGKTIFHEECVGPTAKTEEGRLFDSIPGQLTKNGDAGKHVVIKIDVEGAEWDSFAATGDDVLQLIDQLVVEFHIDSFINDPVQAQGKEFVEIVQRLKRFFHVANLHFNNFSCVQGIEPFPGWAFEVLFVNKQLDTVDPSRRISGLHRLDAQNNPRRADCQP